MRSRRVIAVAALVATLGVSGCASSPEDGTSSTPTSPGTTGTTSGATSEAPEGTTIEITVEDGEFTPYGKNIEVDRGKPITLEIHADEPGQLHIHSTPELTVEYGAGDTSETITLDRFGKVEVESHDAGVIVQLIVS